MDAITVNTELADMGLVEAVQGRPGSQYTAACQRIEAAARTWGHGYEQADIAKLRRFVADVELVVTVNKLHINGLTPADVAQED